MYELATMGHWLEFAVRWLHVITGIAWMPVDPVPITPTRLPAKSTGSCGQRCARNS